MSTQYDQEYSGGFGAGPFGAAPYGSAFTSGPTPGPARPDVDAPRFVYDDFALILRSEESFLKAPVGGDE